MSLSITWANEQQTVIRCLIEMPWAWEETEAAWAQFNGLVRSVEHRVDCIVDLQIWGPAPKNTLQMLYDRYSELAPNVGMIVLVGAPIIFKAIIDVLRLMRPQTFNRYQFVTTIDEAQRFIARERTYIS